MDNKTSKPVEASSFTVCLFGVSVLLQAKSSFNCPDVGQMAHVR